MPDINDLRRARTEAATNMQATADALTALEDQNDASEADLTTAQAAFDAAQSAFEKADRQVKRAEAVETAQANAAQPEPTVGEQQQSGNAPAVPEEKGLKFGAMVRTLAAAGGNIYVARQISEENGQSGLFAASQTVGVGVDGGFLVPEDVSSEIIELLRPASVVLSMGVNVIPMPNGNLTTNRHATGSGFEYGDENDDAPVTKSTYGQMKLSAKKLRGIIPVSNDLLRMASTGVDRMVRDDAVAGAAQATDRNFLRGSGTEFRPKGLRWQLVGTAYEATNVLTMTAAPDVQKIDNDLGKMELALTNANLSHTDAHWIMSPRTEDFLRNLRNANGYRVYPELQDGMLRKKPVHVTTEMPSNLGAGNEAEIMLVHPRHVVVGEHMGITITMSSDAAYKDENGDLQSSFSRDETLMRMIMQHDIGLRHLAAVAIQKENTWGG